MKRADRPKRRLRAFKKYLREEIRNCEKDLTRNDKRAYLKDRIGYHIVKWDAHHYDACLLLYDKRILKYGIDPTSPDARNRFYKLPGDCAGPIIDWIGVCLDHYKSDVWENLNKIIQEMSDIERKPNNNK